MKERKNCLCTAMLFDPAQHVLVEDTKEEFTTHAEVYERFMSIKKLRFLRPFIKKTKQNPVKSMKMASTIKSFQYSVDRSKAMAR